MFNPNSPQISGHSGNTQDNTSRFLSNHCMFCLRGRLPHPRSSPASTIEAFFCLKGKKHLFIPGCVQGASI